MGKHDVRSGHLLVDSAVRKETMAVQPRLRVYNSWTIPYCESLLKRWIARSRFQLRNDGADRRWDHVGTYWRYATKRPNRKRFQGIWERRKYLLTVRGCVIGSETVGDIRPRKRWNVRCSTLAVAMTYCLQGSPHAVGIMICKIVIRRGSIGIVDGVVPSGVDSCRR